MHAPCVLGDVPMTGTSMQTAPFDLTHHLAPVRLGRAHHPLRIGSEGSEVVVGHLSHHILTNRRRQHEPMIARGCDAADQSDLRQPTRCVVSCGVR